MFDYSKFENEPMQVMFYDGEDYSVGIAYGDKIICSCCGGLFGIEDVVEMAQEDKKIPIIPRGDQVNCEDEIRLNPEEMAEKIEQLGLKA